MARGQLTYLQMTNRVLFRLGQTQIASADFAGLASDSWGGIVKDLLNDAQATVYLFHDWSTLITSGTFTTSARTYNLATSFSNFGREISLADTTNGRILTPVQQRDLDEFDPELDDTGAPVAYAIAYPDLLFNRTPSSVAFRLRYVIRPTALSASGDTSLLPEFCDQALVWYCLWQLQASREDEQDRGASAYKIYLGLLAEARKQDGARTDRVYILRSRFPQDIREIVPFPPSYDRNP